MDFKWFDLSGRVAAVTGAGLFLTDKDTAGLEKVRGEITGKRPRCRTFVCDIDNPEEIKVMF